MRSIVTLLLVATFGVCVGCGDAAATKPAPPKPADAPAAPADKPAADAEAK